MGRERESVSVPSAVLLQSLESSSQSKSISIFSLGYECGVSCLAVKVVEETGCGFKLMRSAHNYDRAHR